ncbi:alpha/beta hydrolase [uncultured Paraglaciecola sp.]|uniref:alpha/beta hydrolase family protein n=1 Tax=uncultured Paraglaciecola sp. TaxID=1765024 RepID=UPI00261AF6A3|nr:alpha/beta hydrolase [uncultured Paraglaciecola sp.]
MKRLLLLSFVLISFIANASQSSIEFPKVANNVAYSKVAALSFTAANEKVVYGDDEQQFALLWRTNKTADTELPLVILIHGGCWLSAYDIQHTYALSTGLAQAGFNVWSLEYRRSGKTGGGWPVTFEDIQAGIQASAQYNKGEFTLGNSVAIGHSAGGHLALLAGGVNSQLKGVIGLAAITDIEEYAKGSNSCQAVTKDFMQGMPQDKPVEYQSANPSKQPLHSNTVLLQGDQDNIVPPFKLEQLERKVLMLEGAGHFDWIHPGSSAFALLVEQLRSLAK